MVWWIIYSQGAGLVSFPNNLFRTDVSPTVSSSSSLRGAVRMSTPFYYANTIKTGFNGGLFVADVEHVPCGKGVWPALWMTANTGTIYDSSGNGVEPLQQEDF